MNDSALIQRLLQGEENAFRDVVSEFQPPMLAVARAIIGPAFAEEVVQEAWISIIHGLPNFEGRSSLKTWTLQIVANQAKSRRRKEQRSVAVGHTDELEGVIHDGRFLADGHWAQPPGQWQSDSPEQILESDQLRRIIDQTIESLSNTQSAVLKLHEFEGMNLTDICKILDISESNGRVLLHRARLKVWAVLDQYHRGESIDVS